MQVKAEIMEIVAFLRNPQKFLTLGARSPAGVLLVGPPGEQTPAQITPQHPLLCLPTCALAQAPQASLAVGLLGISRGARLPLSRNGKAVAAEALAAGPLACPVHSYLTR